MSLKLMVEIEFEEEMAPEDAVAAVRSKLDDLSAHPRFIGFGVKAVGLTAPGSLVYRDDFVRVLADAGEDLPDDLVERTQDWVRRTLEDEEGSR